MEQSPKVSIIITTYFRDEALHQAIEKALAQDYLNTEIIVVDDSGEGYAASVVDNYSDVRYVPHETNQGQIAAWNTGISRASGEYIQFHDDDDWLFEDKIRKQVQFLETNPDIGSVYCGIVDQSGVEHLPPKENRGNVVEPVLSHRMYRCQTTTMLTRTDLLEQVFPLKTYPAATDIVLQLEICTKTKFDYLAEALVHRSIDDDGVGSSLVNRQTRIQLVNDYSSLYRHYPKLKQKTLARSYTMLGRKVLEDNVWSLRAISAFVRAIYYSPTQVSNLLWLLVSLFGRPGVSAYERARTTLARVRTGSA